VDLAEEQNQAEQSSTQVGAGEKVEKKVSQYYIQQKTCIQ